MCIVDHMNLDGSLLGFSEGERSGAGVRERGFGMTLADLLDVPDFGLSQLTGPPPGSVRLLGAHVIEIAQPTRWLPSGWVVLTTGLRLRGHTAAQRALIGELASGGMAALGYSVGINTRRVPRALLDEARRLRFPLFTVPREVPMYRIADHVRRVVLRNDPDILREVAGMHAYMAGIFERGSAQLEQQPLERVVMRRLDGLLERSSQLVDLRGNPIWPADAAVASSAPGWEPDGIDPGVPLGVQVDGRERHALPIRCNGRVAGWLIFGNGAPRQELLPLVWAAANLISVIYSVRDRAPAHIAGLRAKLFRAALRERGGDGLDLEAGMSRLGFTLRQQARVVLVEEPDSSSEPAAGLAMLLGEHGLPFLKRVEPARAAYCIEAEREQLDAALRERCGGFAAVGRPGDVPEQLGACYRSAELVWACGQAQRERAAGGCEHGERAAGGCEHGERAARGEVEQGPQTAYWDDLGPASWMLTTADPADAHAWSQRWLEPLCAQPLIIDALCAYLQHDLDTVAAARSLFLHPNSLRYRLTRAEQLLGRRLRAPSTVADLYAALVVTGRLAPT